MAFARSIDPIVGMELTITRIAVETEEESKKQSGDNRTMGRKHIVPYGLYRAHGFISAALAKDTGFSDADLSLLWDALTNMFEHDRSASRGMMAPRRLIVFKHTSVLGNAPAHELFDLVKVERRDGAKPVRAYEDYDVVLDGQNVPKGVEIIEII